MINNRPYVIQTKNLRKRFSEIDIIQSLNLKVPEHSIFGFLGPNGAGKSTTMKILLGLAKPSGGKAEILGHDVQSEGVDIRRKIGYLPQQPNFYQHLTPRQTLKFVARFFMPEDNQMNMRIDQMLELVGLQSKADRLVNGFSGGERQRLGIAQAAIHEPQLLILDEPAAALDPIGRHEMLKIMESLRERATIFYSTHILDDVQQVSDTVAILNKGTLVAQGPIEKLLSSAEINYTVRLRGPIEEAYKRVLKQDWVSSIEKIGNQNAVNNEATWIIRVTDEVAAENQLMSLILADGCVSVSNFGKKSLELEEIFMQLIRGENAK
jgi:ABC-2 type transport system ATP-binding protein